MAKAWLQYVRSVVPTVSPAVAYAAFESGAVLIDVRRPEEGNAGRIDGAAPCPRDALELSIGRYAPDLDTPVVVLCASGVRSVLAARTLLDMGYTQVSSVEGGFTGWTSAGLPTVDGDVTIDHERYARHLVMPTVQAAGQTALSRARVLLVGAGGLGSPSALYLAAAGVGTIGLVDDDRVELSNLQRQVLHSENTLGWPKVASGAATLRGLNSGINVVPHPVRLNAGNASELIGQYDIVVDGSDNFDTRFIASEVARRLKRPYVYGSVYQFEGQVAVFGVDGPCYRCYQPATPEGAAAPNCAEAGVLGVVPGVIGTLQALEAIKLILGVGEPLFGTLLHFDALSCRVNRISIPMDPVCCR